MSGAVEGVALRKIIRDMLDGKAGARDAARQVLTTPPARSYADGVEDDQVLERRVRIAAWNAAKKSGATDALGYAVVDAVVAEFAAIRLLSQGGKA